MFLSLQHLIATRTKLARDLQVHTAGKRVAHYVLCTGDADFRPLCKRLSKYGKHVTIITWAVSASSRLSAVCDDMVYIDDLVGARSASTADMQQCAATVRAALSAMRADPHITVHESGDIVLPGSEVWAAAKRLDAAFSYARFGYSSWFEFCKALQASHPELVVHKPQSSSSEFGISLDMTQADSQVVNSSSGLNQLLGVLRDIAAARKIPAGHLPEAAGLGAALPIFMQAIAVTLALQGEEGCPLPRLRTAARSVGMHRIGGRDDWGVPPSLEQVGITDAQAKSMRAVLAHVSDEAQNALVSLVVMVVGKEASSSSAGAYYAQRIFRAQMSLLSDHTAENVNRAMAAKLKNMLRSAGAAECTEHLSELIFTHKTPQHTAAAAASGSDASTVPQARLSALKTQRLRRESLQGDSPSRPPVHTSSRSSSNTPGEGSHSTLHTSSTSIASSMKSGSWRDQQDTDRTPRGAAFQQGFHNGSFQGPVTFQGQGSFMGPSSGQSSSRSLGPSFMTPNTAPAGMQSSSTSPALGPAAAAASDDTAGLSLPWKHPSVSRAQEVLTTIARAAYAENLKAWRLPGLTSVATHLPVAVHALCGILLNFSKRGEHLTPPAIRTNLNSVGAQFVDDNPQFGMALPAHMVELSEDEATMLRETFASAEVNAVNALVSVVTHLMCVNMSGSDVAVGKRRLQLRDGLVEEVQTVAQLNAKLVDAVCHWLRQHSLVDSSTRAALEEVLLLQRHSSEDGKTDSDGPSPPVSPAMAPTGGIAGGSHSQRGISRHVIALNKVSTSGDPMGDS